MKSFGETIRELRVAQELGLRETAAKIGISPAYLSRIERGKESPPRPEVIRGLAKELAADPDVLFRLSSSTAPELTDFMQNHPAVVRIVRLLMDYEFTENELAKLHTAAERITKHRNRKICDM